MKLDKYPQLEFLHKKFSKSIEIIYTKLVRKQIRSTFVDAEFVSLQDFFSSFDNPAFYTVFQLKNLRNTPCILAFENEIGHALIECMLGGKSRGGKKDITKLELKMIDDLMKQTLISYDDVWKHTEKLNINFVRIEAEQTFLNIYPENTELIEMSHEIMCDGLAGYFKILIPVSVLFGLKDKISELNPF